MRTKAKCIIVSTCLCAYGIIKETIKLEKRFEEVVKYEEDVNKIIDVVNKGIDIENVINIKFK